MLKKFSGCIFTDLHTMAYSKISLTILLFLILSASRTFAGFSDSTCRFKSRSLYLSYSSYSLSNYPTGAGFTIRDTDSIWLTVDYVWLSGPQQVSLLANAVPNSPGCIIRYYDISSSSWKSLALSSGNFILKSLEEQWNALPYPINNNPVAEFPYGCDNLCPNLDAEEAFLATCIEGLGSYDCATQTGECSAPPCSNTTDADGDGFNQCEDCNDGDDTKTTKCKSDEDEGIDDPCPPDQGGQGG